VTILDDFKQRFVYCHKDNESDSLRREAVELGESKQSIEQDRVELRARDIDQMKQTHKPFSFRKTFLRQDVQEQFVVARESS
jgi:hypothetical protein